MIIEKEQLQDVCQKILSAVDSDKLSVLTETLQLTADKGILYMDVTNREYYAQVKLPISSAEEAFKATVNANLFLKLVAQITTESIELYIDGNSLIVKGNGVYKLPLIYNGDKLLELPKIVINNVTSTFPIESSILNSIANYNSKQISIGYLSKPIQKLYYVDGEGAITFTSGACVNTFKLQENIKILLNGRLVKLFKLFKSEKVTFSLGHDALDNDIIQTKVKFESDDVAITAILFYDDTMFSAVPVTAIRKRATDTYPHLVTFNRNALLQSINRLLLFVPENKAAVCYSTFKFGKDAVTLYDMDMQNHETISYNNDNSGIDNEYEAKLDLNELRATLDTCNDAYLTLKFGDHQAFLLVKENITYIIPEVHDI